jgi:hypothetical protein
MTLGMTATRVSRLPRLLWECLFSTLTSFQNVVQVERNTEKDNIINNSL